MRQGIAALVALRTMGTIPVMQEEIFAAKRRDAGTFENHIGEILVGRQRRSGGAILRIPRAAPGAEPDMATRRGDAEQQSGLAIDRMEGQAEFGTGVFRID